MFSNRKLQATLDSSSKGTSRRRKGMGLGLPALLVMAAIIPGLVAATVFLNGTATSTTSGSATTVSVSTCGWEKAKTNGATDANYIQISGSSTVLGTDPSNGGADVYDPLVFTLQGLASGNPTGQSAYEYLDGEFAYVCLSQQQNGAGVGGLATLTASVSSATTGAQYATMDMEWITGVTALPTPVYCAPGGDTGATCSGAAQSSCAGTPPNALYEPNDGGSHYYDWDTVSEANVCGDVNTWVLNYEPSTVYYYGYESFAFVGTSANGLSNLVTGNTWTLTSTVSPNP